MHAIRRNVAEISINEGTGFARGISGRKICREISKGTLAAPEQEVAEYIRSSPRERAPPIPRFTATTVTKEKFKEKVVNLERKYEKLEETLVFL